MHMKAIVYEEYGQPDVLHIAEVAKPVPGDDEVLVKIHAVSINYVDWHVMTGKSILLRSMNGLFKPRKKSLAMILPGWLNLLDQKLSTLSEVMQSSAFVMREALQSTAVYRKPP
jgi:energy-coupling factor transporter ATP-binding protein EcfA2